MFKLTRIDHWGSTITLYADTPREVHRIIEDWTLLGFTVMVQHEVAPITFSEGD